MPTDDELAKFIADCNRRRHGRRGWQAAVQAAARRAIRRTEADPQAHDWDDDPRTAARYDDRYWNNLYDRDED